MGGFDSMVTDGTTEVFFEAAFFAPEAIQGRAKALELTSDAAYRFERGIDFDGTRAALERATGLTLEILGGQAGPVTEAHGNLPARNASPGASGTRARAARLRRARRFHGAGLRAPSLRRGARWRRIRGDAPELALRSRHRGGLRRGSRARARLRARARAAAALQRADAAVGRRQAHALRPEACDRRAGLPGGHQLQLRFVAVGGRFRAQCQRRATRQSHREHDGRDALDAASAVSWRR